MEANLRNSDGKGLVNKALQYLPEMHLSLPSNKSSEKVSNGSFSNTGKYSSCGPGTKVQKRINEGYKGVKSLDSACREHDTYYSKKEKNIAHDILAQKANSITLNPQLSEYDRKYSKLVTGIMGMKSHFGMCSKNLKKCPFRARKK